MTLSQVEHELVALDPVLGERIVTHGTVTLPPTRPYFEALTSSIISQQISVKAAAKIFERFRTITNLDPLVAMNLTDENVKVIGLSAQKTRYIHDLAEHFVNDAAVFNHLDSLSDDEVITELTRVKGIGVWTAQMFLMFTLQRPDVFAPDDRGLQIAIQTIYDLPQLPTRRELDKFAHRWAPYRTIASLHLWRAIEAPPIT